MSSNWSPKQFVTHAAQLQDKCVFAMWYRQTEAPEHESPLKWDPLIYQVVDKNGDATNISLFMESPSTRGRAVLVPVQTMYDFRDVVKLAKQDVKDAASALLYGPGHHCMVSTHPLLERHVHH